LEDSGAMSNLSGTSSGNIYGKWGDQKNVEQLNSEEQKKAEPNTDADNKYI